MKMTSSEACKLLKRLEDNKMKILSDEQKYKVYHAATTENEKELAPDYVFAEVQQAIEIIDRQIMDLKHKLNVFNSTTLVGDTGLTIDQVLIRLPQLQLQKNKLHGMRKLPTKERYQITGNIIDYIYTSYDPDEAQEEYVKVDDEIPYLQLALDKVNNSETFEV